MGYWDDTYVMYLDQTDAANFPVSMFFSRLSTSKDIGMLGDAEISIYFQIRNKWAKRMMRIGWGGMIQPLETIDR